MCCRVCNRLSGYSSYSDIRKNLFVRISKCYYSEKSVVKFFIFVKAGLRFSIRRYLGIRHWNRQFAYYSNIILNVVSGYPSSDFLRSLTDSSLGTELRREVPRLSIVINGRDIRYPSVQPSVGSQTSCPEYQRWSLNTKNVYDRIESIQRHSLKEVPR